MATWKARFVSDCMFAVIKMELYGKTAYGPVLKTMQLSAHEQNHASPEHCGNVPGWRDFAHAQRAAWSLTQGHTLFCQITPF